MKICFYNLNTYKQMKLLFYVYSMSMIKLLLNYLFSEQKKVKNDSEKQWPLVVSQAVPGEQGRQVTLGRS